MTRIRTADQIRKWKATSRQREKLLRPFKPLACPRLCPECRHESTMWAKKGTWCFACEVRLYKEPANDA